MQIFRLINNAIFLIVSMSFSMMAYSQNSLTPTNIDWPDLKPNLPNFNDPFVQLTPNQLDDLGYFVGLQNDIQRIKTKTPNDKKLSAKNLQLAQLKADLNAQGIDVEQLLAQRENVIEQRKLRATEINNSLLAKKISLSGYIVPIKAIESGVTKIFFVATNPLFSYGHDHASPDPNQVIMIQLNQPMSFDFAKRYQVSGLLAKQHYQQVITVPDGHQVEFESSYSLNLQNLLLAN